MRRGAAQNLDKRNDKSQGFAKTGGSIDVDILKAAEQRNGGDFDGGAELEARV